MSVLVTSFDCTCLRQHVLLLLGGFGCLAVVAVGLSLACACHSSSNTSTHPAWSKWVSRQGLFGTDQLTWPFARGCFAQPQSWHIYYEQFTPTYICRHLAGPVAVLQQWCLFTSDFPAIGLHISTFSMLLGCILCRGS